MIKKLLNKKLILNFLNVILLTAVFVPSANAMSFFNSDPSDFPTLQVSNYTKNPNCNTCWVTSVSADKGEVVSFLVYYHNSSNETARQTKIKIDLPPASFTTQNISAELWAQNANIIYGSAPVTLTSSQTLTFIPGSVRWYDHLNNQQSLLYGQQGSEIVSGSGLNIGDIEPGWQTQGYVTFRAQVSNTNTQQPPAQSSIPTVNTGNASAVTSSSAILNGSINPNNSNTSTWFEYGNTPSFGNTTAAQNIGSGNSPVNTTFSVSGLNQNASYFYRAVAQNSNGTVLGNTVSFLTASNQQNISSAPTVNTNSALGITTNSATLDGSINPNGSNTNTWFEYGISQSFGNTTVSRNLGGGNSQVDNSINISGLTANTQYFFRTVAQNPNGTSFGNIMNFTTSANQQAQGSAPSANTNSAYNITSSSAVLDGSVIPNSGNTVTWFEWGPTSSLGNTTNSQTIGSGSSQVDFNNTITNLAPNTSYYYRIVAQNPHGTNYGNVLNFFTQPNYSYSNYPTYQNNYSYYPYQSSYQTYYPNYQYQQNMSPVAQTNSAYSITSNSAALDGIVNPNNNDSTVWYEWGPTTALGTITNYKSLSASSYSSNQTQYVYGLNPSTTYYYRIVARNSYGTTYGGILNFTTQISYYAPYSPYGPISSNTSSVTTSPASSIYQTSAMLNGSAIPNGYYTTAWFEWGENTNFLTKTAPQSIGQGFYSTPVSVTLTNLSPGKTYYFRAAAQNSYGTSYGGILNFTTQTSSYTPAVYYQTTTVSGNAINLISLTSSVGSGNLNNGEVSYTVNYKNNSNYSANNAKLRITFPAEVTFKNSSLIPFTFEGNNSLLYKLDKIGARSEGSISVSFKIDTSVIGSKSITFNADINYSLPGGGTESKITFANLEINGGSALASLLSAMGTLLGNWFIDLLIGLAIGFGIYHFFIRKKTVDVLK